VRTHTQFKTHTTHNIRYTNCNRGEGCPHHNGALGKRAGFDLGVAAANSAAADLCATSQTQKTWYLPTRTRFYNVCQLLPLCCSCRGGRARGGGGPAPRRAPSTKSVCFWCRGPGPRPICAAPPTHRKISAGRSPAVNPKRQQLYSSGSSHVTRWWGVVVVVVVHVGHGWGQRARGRNCVSHYISLDVHAAGGLVNVRGRLQLGHRWWRLGPDSAQAGVPRRQIRQPAHARSGTKRSLACSLARSPMPGAGNIRPPIYDQPPLLLRSGSSSSSELPTGWFFNRRIGASAGTDLPPLPKSRFRSRFAATYALHPGPGTVHLWACEPHTAAERAQKPGPPSTSATMRL
jgi:hypothetical protein